MDRKPRIEVVQESVTFYNLPFPPSVNESLLPSRGRFIHTEVFRQFKNSMNDYWLSVSNSQLINAKLLFKELQKPKFYGLILTEIALMCPYERIWTKAGAPKNFDDDNRIKAIRDAICSRMDFNDKFIFETRITKNGLKDVKKGQDVCNLTIRI